MARRRVRKGKKGVRRRVHRKRGHNKVASTLALRSPSALPDRLKVKLRYVERITLSAGVPAALYQFRGNSVFDPNYTGTGHQPYMFDQWANMFQRYRVYGSSIQVDAINTSATCAAILYVAPAEDETTASLASLDYLAELPRSGYSKILAVASRTSNRIKRYVSTRAICGITKAQLADDTYAAAVTGNPGRIWTWDIVAGSMDNSTALSSIYMEVKLTYYCEFFAPYIQSQS